MKTLPHGWFHRLGGLAISAGLAMLACGLLFAALLGRVPGAWAATAGVARTYPGSAPCDTTLQACLDGASTGDTIVVQPGVYVTATLSLNHAVSLTGVSSATVTLQALANQRVLSVTSDLVDSSVIISGLTFSGGQAVGSDCPAGCGGGIWIYESAEPRLVNVILTGNSAGFWGGAVYAEGDLISQNTQFISNTAASDGGAVHVGGVAYLTGGLFRDNECFSECLGGGLFAYNGVVLAGTQFLSNTAGDAGGGMWTRGSADITGGFFQYNQCTQPACAGGGFGANSSDAPVTLTDTQFISNTANGSGGGAEGLAHLRVVGGLFQGNQCLELGCGGGGLALDSSVGSLSISGARFVRNIGEWGGGVFAYGPTSISNTHFIDNQGAYGGAVHQAGFSGQGEYVNDLFAGNTASGDGQALYLAAPAGAQVLFSTIARSGAAGPVAAIYVPTTYTVGITNTLIASYTFGIQNVGGTVSEDYNLFSGVVTPTLGAVVSGGHSDTGTAAFHDPSLADYHLRPGSAGVDAGIDAGISADIDGDARPFGSGFDIGYDEVFIRYLFLPLIIR